MKLSAISLAVTRSGRGEYIAPTPVAPVNFAAPVVSGTTGLGDTLTTTDGAWTGYLAPTFTRQWQRNGANISGATGPTRVIQVADSGATLRCVVTATNASGSATANSNNTTVQTFTVPVLASVPTISGTAEVGQLLTASPSGATGNPAAARTWQWLRDGANISGATSSSYTLVTADSGTDITVRQTETNSLGSDSAVSTAVTVQVDGVPAGLYVDAGYVNDNYVMEA
jgi:hypothetical protein